MPERRFRSRVLLGALGLGAAGVFLLAPGVLGRNFHEVVPGRVFRSAQLSPEALEAVLSRYGIKSVLNLRGAKPGRDWYDEEAELVRSRGLVFEDLDIPKRLPSRVLVLQLIDRIETLPEPVLLHCKAGADRSGFASVIARMVRERETLEAARAELGLAYGHLSWGASAELSRFFDLYASYLETSHAPDTPETFRKWVAATYVPYNHLAHIERVVFPESIAPGSVVPVAFRVTNVSPLPWRFQASQEKGIRLGFKIRGEGRPDFEDYHRAGFFNLEVPAGKSVELKTELKAPAVPGAYDLKVDMVDEHVAWFEDEGSPPLLLPLLVRP